MSLGATVSRLRRLAGRARNKLGPRAAVLLYHRVSDSISDPYLLRVRAKHFAEQMEVLRRHPRLRPMPLRELARAHRDKRLPHRAVAVTFDDGYIDNLRIAKPILEQHDLNATVFMTAGPVGRAREFWWDELERIVLHPEKLPRILETEFGRWDLGDAATIDSDFERIHASWDLTHATDPTLRHRLLRDIHGVIRTMAHAPRESVLDQLAAWAGVGQEVRADRRAMSDDEIAELGADGRIEVGAHTNFHTSLPSQSLESQGEEIAGSRSRLESILGHPVTSFAYPYGDHCPQTVEVVRKSGIEAACACEGRIIVPRSDPLLIPRMDMLDWDGDTFARQLERWLRG